MAVTAVNYGMFIKNLGLAQFNLTTDTLKVALFTSSYVPNVDTDEMLSTISANEIGTSGTGYTAGGKTLTNVAWTYDGTSPTDKRMLLTADSVTWSGVTFTAPNGARYAVVYKSTGVASTSRLIGYIDFGTARTPSSEDFTLAFTNGVTKLKIA